VLKVGQNYSIEMTKGMVLVAYPVENQATEFEFSYWVDSNVENYW
jgi:hypothetical protein